MDFEMLHSSNNNYELLRYVTNTIKIWKTEIKSIFKIVCRNCFNVYSFFVVGRRGRGGLIREGGLITKFNLQTGGFLERGAY